MHTEIDDVQALFICQSHQPKYQNNLYAFSNWKTSLATTTHKSNHP